MPTTKPRITVTLPPHHHEVLTRLSLASGDSMSEILAGFVELAIPSLERVVVVLERARSAPEEVRAGLAAAFERADMDVMPQLLAAQGQGEMFLDRAAEAVRSEGSTPVPVTRGSGGGKTRRPGVIEGAIDALQEGKRLTRRQAAKAKAVVRGRGSV